VERIIELHDCGINRGFRRERNDSHINRSVLLIEFCNLDYRYLSGTGQKRRFDCQPMTSGLP
jgi:hypothetical protein